MQATAHRYISVEEYLDGELRSEIKHEYIGGDVYAMAGVSVAHNTIALNLALCLRQHLGTGPCKVFMSDVKLRLDVKRTEIFYYPDIHVSCDPADNHDYYKSRPVFVAEVMSPGTERFDRHEKFPSYLSLPTLQEYLLVSQHEPAATLFRRVRQWHPEPLGPDSVLTLPALNQFTVPVAALFAGVTFTPRA